MCQPRRSPHRASLRRIFHRVPAGSRSVARSRRGARAASSRRLSATFDRAPSNRIDRDLVASRNTAAAAAHRPLRGRHAAISEAVRRAGDRPSVSAPLLADLGHKAPPCDSISAHCRPAARSFRAMPMMSPSCSGAARTAAKASFLGQSKHKACRRIYSASSAVDRPIGPPRARLPFHHTSPPSAPAAFRCRANQS